MNRNRITFLNALSAIMMTLTNGLLGIIVTKLIIQYYGSDFNGVNSTANQIINVLLVIEGGFTIASNVMLFKPLGDEDYQLVNEILYVTQKKFHKIGIIFGIVGLIVSILYASVINSDTSFALVVWVLVLAIFPTAINLYYASTYRVLIQTMQKEYVINFANVITLGLGHITTIVMIILGGSVWLVRLITMIFAVINSILIIVYAKRKCDFLDIKEYGIDVVIPGTRDVMIQKITGVIYNAAPIIFLSISSSGGTIMASVYAVYNNVFNMIKSIVRSFMDAPRLSIGQLITKRSREELWPLFKQYEFISVILLFIVCTVTYVLILPFVNIYAMGITDANYYDSIIALLMTLITIFELLHIPSGHMLNMAGKFKVSMYFQLIACIVLIVGMLSLGSIWGMYGFIISVLIVSIMLAILEIGYIHFFYFSRRIKEFILMIIPFIGLGIVISIIEKRFVTNIEGYLSFILYGITLSLINSIIAVAIGCGVSFELMKSLLARGISVMKKGGKE